MRANYSTRRTSVVFNPRARVFGGLGEDGPPGGGDVAEGSYGGDGPPGGGDVVEGSYNTAQQAFQAAEKEVFQASTDAANANAAAAAQVKSSINVTKIVETVFSFTPAGKVIGIFQAIGNLIVDRERAKTDPAYAAYLAEGTKLAAQAVALAAGPGGDSRLLVEATKVQNSLANLTAANKASSEAAVILLYQTYAKRNPDPASLAYWSNAFGPTITADEVFAFQEALYRNEPNLRPMAVATQTTAQTGTNLALPIIAAVAGFLLFGG